MPAYAGIGSRSTPPDILELMERIADACVDDGLVLRTGHAEGADQAFERGCAIGGGECEIYLPWRRFQEDIDYPPGAMIHTIPSPAAMMMAAEYHPAWQSLSAGARKMHARNCHQILGYTLNDPVEFVVCWTPGGKEIGGTAQALRIAKDYHIPVSNLAHAEVRADAYQWVL